MLFTPAAALIIIKACKWHSPNETVLRPSRLPSSSSSSSFTITMVTDCLILLWLESLRNTNTCCFCCCCFCVIDSTCLLSCWVVWLSFAQSKPETYKVYIFDDYIEAINIYIYLYCHWNEPFKDPENPFFLNSFLDQHEIKKLKNNWSVVGREAGKGWFLFTRQIL